MKTQKPSTNVVNDPAPRFAAAWAALVYAAATLSVSYPALTGAFLVNPWSDQFKGGYPVREFAASMLRSGQGFPQWNPYLFGGMPYVAAMHGDIFYPTFLLRMIMPTDQAMTWSFAIHLFLAGLFTYGFLRAWGVGFFGALVGGLAYMLSGPIAGYASPGHDGKLYVSALLPLTLWFLVRGVRDGRAWAWGALALTAGAAVLSPHPQLLQYMLLVNGAFALFLAFAPDEQGIRLPRDAAFRRLGFAFGAVVLGGVIGAIQYLPLREYVDWSPRAGGRGYEHAVSYSMPLEELFNTMVPQFSGILMNYWGRNGIHFHSEYAGVVALVLAGAGLGASAVSKRARWFWGGTFIVSLLWTLGGSTPFYRLIYVLVPGTKFFRAPSTMMFVTMFSIAVFAAFGTERVVNASASFRKRFLIGWLVAIGVIGLVMAGGLPVMVAENIYSGLASVYGSQIDVARYVDRARANQHAVVLGAFRSVGFVGMAIALVWLCRLGHLRGRVAAWILVALIGLDLWTIERRYWIFSSPASVLYASDPAIDYVKQAEPGRVLAMALGYNGMAQRDMNFDGDALMVHRLRNVMGYHGNELRRYQRLFGVIPDTSEQYNGEIALSPSLWRHENVRYLYTNIDSQTVNNSFGKIGIHGFKQLVGPVRDAAGSYVFLYRTPGDNPPAWVATVMVRGTDDQALATILDPRFDPARAAIVDSSQGVPTVEPTAVPEASGVQVNVIRYEAGRVDVQLSRPARQGEALVVSENYFLGWHAEADGKPAAVARMNFNLTGVVLPAGARQVELRFVDAAYIRGKSVTLVALILAMAAVLGGVVFERRRPVGAA